jgi:hypothetical protein|tara:strand:- start:2026 stop:2175 length:150 start_codon:yes stop_codon:yes gene_type:complete
MLVTPSDEEIRYWFQENACEAACEEQCWVELDGHCEHGKESWFLRLGLI